MAKKENQNRLLERKIFFYKVVCYINDSECKLNDVFNRYITALNSDYENLEERGLAIPYFEKYHFLDLFQHETDASVYKGQFYSLRLTDFPYLFNMQNGNRQEIFSSDRDTLMEQTHFVCFTNQRLIVSEFNFFGARIEKLANYLVTVMSEIIPSTKIVIKISPIVIPEYFKQITNCSSVSKVQFKVAHAGLQILSEENIIGISDISKHGLDETTDFYIDIEISGGKKNRTLPIKNVKTFLSGIVSCIKRGNEHDFSTSDENASAFKKAKIKAFNPDESKIIPYDLLDEKLVHTCKVEKLSEKTKYVDSKSMFKHLFDAYNEQKDRALKYMERI